RIKITVHEHGIDEIRELVEAAFLRTRAEFDGRDRDVLERLKADFAPPAFVASSRASDDAAREADLAYRVWADTNLTDHRRDDHAIVTISLKPHGAAPGDATAGQMRLMADLAEAYGYGELRIAHTQNVVLPHVPRAHLPALHAALGAAGLGTANVGLASDIIACPGMDYCALATARSIPVAQELAERIEELRIEHEVGPLQIKISGCINACGHHHVGHIGILGLDRAGVENYQITLGGDATEHAAIGQRMGPGFSYEEVVPAIERLLYAYLDLREEAESFADTVARAGLQPFKDALYGGEGTRDAA
ncbi:MAG: nitrite/sulfite reductase, partial [Pseudomonadota bacterium]